MEDDYGNIHSRRQKGIIPIKFLPSKLNIDLKEPTGLLMYILEEINLYYVYVLIFLLYNTINSIFEMIY